MLIFRFQFFSSFPVIFRFALEIARISLPVRYPSGLFFFAMSAPPYRFIFGSNASRSPSPTNTVSSITVKRAAAGNATSHQAKRNLWASCISSPHDGVIGGSPKPRKSSAASEPIAPIKRNGKSVMSGVSAFGSTCEKIILRCENPRVFAASTNGSDLSRRNSARM